MTVCACAAASGGGSKRLLAQEAINLSDSALRDADAGGEIEAAPPAPRCAGERISEIVIRPRQPFMRGLLDRWQVISRAVSHLHTTTQPDIIRRFLVLQEGDPCTELRRAESERILRAQPYLASAEVRPEPDGAGGVRLVVETVDEVTLIVGVAASTASPQLRTVRGGDGNLFGQALSASAQWTAPTYGRTGFGVRIADYQALGEPYQFAGEARRDQIGGVWRLVVSHPYYTDLQRIAWRANAGSAHEFLALRQDGTDEVAIGSHRDYYDVGAILRVGVPGRLSLFGASVSGDRGRVDPMPVRFTPDAVVEVPGELPALAGYLPTHSSRINALWGVRSISFLPVRGFDALNGVQDARRGLQAGALFGRTLSVLGSRDDDIFVSADVYIGGGSERSFTMFRAQGEGRQDYDSNQWDGLLSSGRLTWYAHLAPSQTLVAAGEWSGGWRARAPFQLLLGDPEGGVRGYGQSAASGGRRAVARVESRWVLGQFRASTEYGLAAFTDAGRLWAGDVPYGDNTSTRVGVGMSLLAALPPGSQRLWRLDVAYPVSPDPRARLEIRLSSSNLSRFGWRESRDVSRAREQSVPNGIFNWP